jgi:hypothetical protein
MEGDAGATDCGFLCLGFSRVLAQGLEQAERMPRHLEVTLDEVIDRSFHVLREMQPQRDAHVGRKDGEWAGRVDT